ncbi:MAG TPA: hypothetical protein VIS95_03430 [Solirubrobacterales bacterium]
MAVDSEGNLYVVTGGSDENPVVYTPTTYNPEAGEIEYDDPPDSIFEDDSLSSFYGIAINAANDRLFINLGSRIAEYGTAEEGNPLLDDNVATLSYSNGFGLAVDAAHKRIYAVNREGGDAVVVRVFDLEAPHALLQTVNGSTAPNGKFFSGELSIAADEGNGNFFVYDQEVKKVYEFTEAGGYVTAYEHSFKGETSPQIAADNGPLSPNGGENKKGVRHLYVPSHPSGVGHLFAFGPELQCAPEIESLSFEDVTESEAVLRATINPCELKTGYRFEVVTELAFEAEGEEAFDNATVAGEGAIPPGASGVPVSAAVTGLEADTAYRFRVVATNEKGDDKAEDAFTTYPAQTSVPCPNDAFRTGPSALLPDCRAYELVTPPDTNARAPFGAAFLGIYFPTRQASPAGDKVSFQIEGGVLPGAEGTGALAGDPYLSTRGAGGWSTASAGPDGLEAAEPVSGSVSPDQGHSFWSSGVKGTTSIGGLSTAYVRYPDGHSELLGQGSLEAIDPQAEGRLIGENGGHIVFASTVALEPESPPSGTKAIYDRTPDGVTHVASLLPEDVTPAAGANYEGASLDGKGIAFKVAGTLYLRHDNDETYAIGTAVTYAGIAEGGERIFYLEGGDLYAFDVAAGKITFTESPGNDVTPVNVATGGTAAYFVSPSVLTGGSNPEGATPENGRQNLYLSQEGAISFVGIVTKRDVDGESNGNFVAEGLGLWTEALSRPAKEPSRTTPDGDTLLFESRANLTEYDAEETAQVYRYDFTAEELACLSCNPTGMPPSGRGSLQSIMKDQGAPGPFGPAAYTANVRADGRRAFFQSGEPLVAEDTDGLQDVYEWEEAGVGTCTRPAGCISLISSGHSARPDYLYAVSGSGEDVFVRTADLLLASDADETPSIYDARAGGGFPPATPAEGCQGEGCRPNLSPPPTLPTPGMLSGEAGNVSHRCPKGRKKAKRNGETVCFKKKRRSRKHAKHRRHRAGADQKGFVR